MALLTGLAVAPYTHAHQSSAASSDRHGHTLVHTHASPHAHPHAEPPGHHDADHDTTAGTHDHADRIWSVTSFVFPPPLAPHPPLPVLFVTTQTVIDVASVWHGVSRPEPRAHGPPLLLSSPLRAPPVFLPAFS